MVVYKITNLINNKIYIGQTISDVKYRWWAHCKPSKRNGQVISRAIQKYGKDNFTFEVIDSALNIDELNNKETYWIEYYNSRDKEKGYNVAFGGGNRAMPEETKQKLSKVNSGKKKPPISDEHRRKLSEAAKKRTMRQETKDKISKSHIGVKPSEETRVKLSLAKKGKKHA